MKIKIFGRNQELFNKNLTDIMNVATVVARTGTIPTDYDIENAERSGGYWIRENSRFNIFGSTNDNWANIREEGKNFIVVEFSTRYDKMGFPRAKSLSDLILAWFDACTELVE